MREGAYLARERDPRGRERGYGVPNLTRYDREVENEGM